MPRVSDEYLTERQDQVLDAATLCFAEGGFHATGMADVIRASGLSAGSVYRYYKSKDDLIAAIITRLLGQLHARLDAVSQEAHTPAELLRAGLDVTGQVFSGEDKRRYARLLPQVWTEALRNPAIAAHVQASYGTVLDVLESRLEGMASEGALPPDVTPRGAAHLILAAFQGFMLQSLLLGEGFSAETYRQAAEGMFGTEHPA